MAVPLVHIKCLPPQGISEGKLCLQISTTCVLECSTSQYQTFLKSAIGKPNVYPNKIGPNLDIYLPQKKMEQEFVVMS